MNDEWKEWARLNLKRGCSRSGVESKLKEKGFSDKEISQAMNLKKSGFSKKLKDRFNKKNTEKVSSINRFSVDYQKLSEVNVTNSSVSNRIEDDRVQIYVINDFLSSDECKKLIAQIDSDLRPSTVTSDEVFSSFRTSRTCDIGLKNNKAIKAVDKKISTMLGVNLAWSEIMQGQKYEVGQEFKEHKDFFTPNTKKFEDFASVLGQRTWTFMVYLNSTCSGGETHFTSINKKFKPLEGTAVVWNNLYPTGEPNFNTMHHGMPVLDGNKYIITKWFRDKGKGNPFLS